MKWKYRVFDSKDFRRDGLLKGRSRESIERFLNKLGSDVGEVINITFRELESRSSFTGVAKRPIEIEE